MFEKKKSFYRIKYKDKNYRLYISRLVFFLHNKQYLVYSPFQQSVEKFKKERPDNFTFINYYFIFSRVNYRVIEFKELLVPLKKIRDVIHLNYEYIYKYIFMLFFFDCNLTD
jgi:hypothetical protein